MTCSPHSIYEAWKGLKKRCNNVLGNRYHRYGGRGITYDPRYEDFYPFLDDMREGWKPGLVLDRKDNDKGYYKDNLQWVTPLQSNQNKSTSKITFEVAEEIRKEYTLGLTRYNLAEKYNVAYNLICDVIRGRTWTK
jgi:hypothetical protein